MGKVTLAIDFGSKTSGYTAAALQDERNKITLYQARKGENADIWLKELIQRTSPEVVAIDAPLSLPGVYSKLEHCSNHHYRHCDLEAGAMSPMFLGGLTARAIELKSWLLQNTDAEVIEVYPKLVAQRLALDKRYKKDSSYLEEALVALDKELTGTMPGDAGENWHRFDALMALIAANRYVAGTAEKIGLETEGIIYF